MKISSIREVVSEITICPPERQSESFDSLRQWCKSTTSTIACSHASDVSIFTGKHCSAFPSNNCSSSGNGLWTTPWNCTSPRSPSVCLIAACPSLTVALRCAASIWTCWDSWYLLYAETPPTISKHRSKLRIVLVNRGDNKIHPVLMDPAIPSTTNKYRLILSCS